jgi:hypothetical protein
VNVTWQTKLEIIIAQTLELQYQSSVTQTTQIEQENCERFYWMMSWFKNLQPDYHISKAGGGTASSSFVSSLVKQILLRTFTTLHFLHFKMQVTHIWCKSTVDTCPWWFNISFNIFSVPKHRNKRLKVQLIHSVLHFTVIESICIQCWSNENLEVCDVINKYRNH